MKLRTMLSLCFIGYTLVAFLMGFFSYSENKRLLQDVVILKESVLLEYSAITDAQNAIRAAQKAILTGFFSRYHALHEPDEYDVALENFHKSNAQLEIAFRGITKSLNDYLVANKVQNEVVVLETERSREEAEIQNILLLQDMLRELRANLEKLGGGFPGDLASFDEAYMHELEPQLESMDKIASDLVGVVREESFQYINGISSRSSKTFQSLGFVICLLTVLGMLVGYFLVRTISRPLEELSEIVTRFDTNQNSDRFTLSSNIVAEVSLLGAAFDKVISEREVVYGNQIHLVKEREEITTDRSLKLEVASRAKKDFLVNVSHEFRLPVDAIIELSLVLESSIDPELLGEFRAVPGQVKTAGLHLLSLVNNVNEIAQSDKSEFSVKISECSLESIVSECVDMCMGAFRNKNIRIKIKNVNYRISSDPLRLSQVFLNLLMNAIKFSRDSGVVTIEAVCTHDNKIEVCIEDTGVGISVEAQSDIFKPHARLLHPDASCLVGEAGGLALVKEFLNAMGGEIWFQSIEGEGSKFCISQPRFIS